ncbi:hypothetical protein Tsubulata_036484 [Turnera subulata]|uniref:Protein arginine N-methyltransferase domain-containing protein n=1 Tax=Turnera subulata TaxID=218843 RepID=A0A9Q0JC32_9ROSI|nr:hypothetical protein Tsubulata_036484 [Turnera subulata]
MPISKGEEVLFQAVHSDTTVSYNLATRALKVGEYDSRAKDFYLILSPEKIAVYGDKKWRASVSAALLNAVQERDHLLCVVADDSVFSTLLAARSSKMTRVISLFPGLRDMGTQYVQAVADASGLNADNVKVIQKKYLTLHDTNQRKIFVLSLVMHDFKLYNLCFQIDLLIGEPYYYGNDGMLPWQNLRFWKDRTMLDSVLSEDVIIMPCKAKLRACAMSLPDFWNSRRCLGEIEGFDHSVVNITLGACGDLPAPQEGPILPFFVWQSGEIKELTAAFTVMEFDFSKPIGPCHGKIQVDFTDSGICHGFVLWIDWVMDARNSIVLSTGPVERYWKQGVKLLQQPVEVEVRGSGATKNCSAMLEASFDPSSGELVVKHALS